MRIGLLEKKLEGGGVKLTPPLPCDRWENSPPEEGLMAKFYIYRSKVQDTVLNSKLFLKELYNRYCIEKEIHKNSMTFKTSWLPYMDIFRGLI